MSIPDKPSNQTPKKCTGVFDPRGMTDEDAREMARMLLGLGPDDPVPGDKKNPVAPTERT